MTALMRTTDRGARTTPGWPRRFLVARSAKLVLLPRGRAVSSTMSGWRNTNASR